MTGKITKRFDMAPLSPDIQEKVECSERESQKLSLRSVHCPLCHFTVGKVFSDAIGHIKIKCPKCKCEKPLNLAYFRRAKGAYKLKRKYYGEMYDD